MEREDLGMSGLKIGFSWSKLLLPAKGLVLLSLRCLLQLPTSARVSRWQGDKLEMIRLKMIPAK